MEGSARSRARGWTIYLRKGNEESSPSGKGASTRFTRRSNARAPSAASHRLDGVSALPHRRPRDASRYRLQQHSPGRPDHKALVEPATRVWWKDHPGGDLGLFSEVR